MSKPCDNCGSDLKVCKDCDLYTGKYVKAEIKTELEKIKAEIEHKKFIVLEVLGGCGYYDGLNTALEIIDNHISELKG